MLNRFRACVRRSRTLPFVVSLSNHIPFFDRSDFVETLDLRSELRTNGNFSHNLLAPLSLWERGRG
jgi:hypothetical protein